MISPCRNDALFPPFASVRALRSLVTRGFLCALLAAVLSPTETSAARFDHAAPAVHIIYTADTLGYLHPCVGCGGSSQGGLARRVALLPKIAAATVNPLVIAGPDEFYADREAPSGDTAKAMGHVLHEAFSRMPYTAIYLSPAAVRDMKTHSLALPPNGVAVASEPVTRVFRAGNLAAACIFLPSGTGGSGEPGPDQILAAQVAAKEAAKTADLVIGISPWGMRAENSLAASFTGYFHILLGGGHGIALPGQATGDLGTPGPLWVRSDRKGRAINVLDIFSVPAHGSPWLEGVHFTARLEFLALSLPEDEETVNIIGKLKD